MASASVIFHTKPPTPASRTAKVIAIAATLNSVITEAEGRRRH